MKMDSSLSNPHNTKPNQFPLLTTIPLLHFASLHRNRHLLALLKPKVFSFTANPKPSKSRISASVLAPASAVSGCGTALFWGGFGLRFGGEKREDENSKKMAELKNEEQMAELKLLLKEKSREGYFDVWRERKVYPLWRK